MIPATQSGLCGEGMFGGEECLRSILNNVLDAIITIDTHGRIRALNPSVERIFGYGEAELLGQNVTMLMSNSDAVRHDQYLDDYLDTGKAQIIGIGREVICRRKDGTVFHADLAVSEVREGNQHFFIGILRDISERKKMELQLQEARDAAFASSEAKSRFLADMSHEIRTSMNGVLGNLSLLQLEDLKPEHSDYINTAVNSAKMLLNLLNDILDLSKIEAQKLQLEKIPFSLAHTVEDVVSLFSKQALDKGIEVASLLSSAVPDLVIGDPTRLRQILSNLVSNAIKFTHEGEVTVHVDVAGGTSESPLIRFRVSDTGVGMEPQALVEIFKPFAQGEASITRKYGGTGLGLDIVNKLTHLMDGCIDVESTASQGTRFTVVMPFDVADPHTDDAASIPSLEALRAILFSEEAGAQNVLRPILEGWGIHCCEIAACGAADVMKPLSLKDTLDLVVLDVFSLTRTHLALIHQIKGSPVGENARVVLIATVGGPGDNMLLNDAGVDGYLVRPFDEMRLRDCLVQTMKRDAYSAKPVITQHHLAEAAADLRGRILIVEDNHVNQKIAVAMVARLGYRSSIANNGREAIDALFRQRYDLVLMDCHMPELDGFEATAKIRKLEGNGPHIPIIALTADAMLEDKQRCLAVGMNDYLSKPIMLERLCDVLSRWFSGNT